MFKKIYLLPVFFLVTAFFHSNNDALLMKCADIKYEKLQKTYERGGTLTLELLFKDNLEKRLSHWSGYARLYRNCEFELKSTPQTFKKIYK